MNQSIENRREFLKRASLLAVSFPLIINCKSNILAQGSDENILSLIKRNANTSPTVNWCGAIDAPDDISWKTVLSKKSDRDETITVSGTVFEADGQTPAPNVLIYFYHTDSEGYYRRGHDEVLHGHFRGWMLTNAQGKYEFRTIKPAPYPNRTEAAHIHMTLTGKSFKEESIDSILFEGDKFITPSERNPRKGGFNPILKLEKTTNGSSHATRDIQLWKV
jgi:protocatechuate 3,4-dioxygenase, beta subunit